MKNLSLGLSSVLSPKHDKSADADLASQRCLAFLNEFSGGGGDGSASTAESTAMSERLPSPKSKQKKSRRRFRQRRRRREESENVVSGNNAPPSPRKQNEKRRRHRRSKSRRDERDDNNRRSCSRSRRRDESTDTRNPEVEEESAIARDFEMIYNTLPPVEAARQIMIYLQGIGQEHQEKESAIYLDPEDVSVVSSISGFDSIHSGALTVCSTSIGDDSIPSINRPPAMVGVVKNDRSLESLIDDDDDCVLYFA